MRDKEELIRKLRNRINVQQSNAKGYENEAEEMVQKARHVKKEEDEI